MHASADYSTVESISKRLIEATDAMDAMIEDVAKARVVRDYDSDRRKAILSSAVADFLKDGESATAAEHKARSSQTYAECMKLLRKELEAAETTVAKWEAAKLRFEAARSLLSIQKQLITNL